jgi:inner membrane protein
MPTIMTHAAVAVGLGAVFTGFRRLPSTFWSVTAALAMLPDVDVVAFALGVPYDSIWSHRGASHSPAVAAAVAVVAAAATRRRLRIPAWFAVLWFFLAMASHGLLDALTSGGLGVAFLFPYDTGRYFLPCRPVAVSPIGLGFFSPRGLRVLASEARWLLLPTAVVVALAWLAHRAARADG